MFKKAQHIDTAFRHTRLFSLLFLLACTGICIYCLSTYRRDMQKNSGRIYILENGKLFMGVAINRSDSLVVEMRDHISMFHFYFFNLEPDDEMIERNMAKALYLADGSASRAFHDLKESGYYTNLISGNIRQQLPDYDSIAVDLSEQPARFRFFGKEKIMRATSIVTRSLITEGTIRVLSQVSSHNPHGMLIEHWSIVENKDLKTENR